MCILFDGALSEVIVFQDVLKLVANRKREVAMKAGGGGGGKLN